MTVAVILIPQLITPPAAPIPETASTTISAAIPDVPFSSTTTIGTSVEGRPIDAYRFGTGSTTLVFVGGIHGGYEWNSVLLAYDMIDSLRDGDITVPDSVQVQIVPNANPDGVYAVIGKDGRFTRDDVSAADDTAVGTGRFNANGIDLNRNFACRWQPTSTWRGTTVSAGDTAFSEPEAAALRDYLTALQPAGVIFWHSQANAVYGSECGDGILPGTTELLNTYATAAGYTAVPVFDAYPVSGDAEGWLASIGIPAITVELSSHTLTDWAKNQAAVQAVLTDYAK